MLGCQTSAGRQALLVARHEIGSAAALPDTDGAVLSQQLRCLIHGPVFPLPPPSPPLSTQDACNGDVSPAIL